MEINRKSIVLPAVICFVAGLIIYVVAYCNGTKVAQQRDAELYKQQRQSMQDSISLYKAKAQGLMLEIEILQHKEVEQKHAYENYLNHFDGSRPERIRKGSK